MSASTLPFLQRQLKPKLLEFAQHTSLKDYKTKNKSDLAAVLNDHLRANQSRYSRDELFSEFYERMSRATGRATPTTPSTGSPRRSPRKAKVQEVEDVDEESDGSSQRTESSDESSGPPTPPLRRTPMRPLDTDVDGSPMSPKVVTDAIDQQTTRIRQRASEVWESTGMIERSDSLRSMLSSVKAIEIIVLVVEGVCIMSELVPTRYLTTLPPMEALNTPEYAIKVPDLFILVDSAFWAPYSLWLLTNLLLPLGFAYFFNLSLRAAQSSRGRVSSRVASFDPLSYNIAKALLAHAVYKGRFTFWNAWSGYSAARVNAALPGQWPGVLTGTAVGVIGALYEAILRK